MTYLLLLLQALTHFKTTEYAVKSSKGSKISNSRMCVCQYASVCMLNHTGAYKARTCWVYVVFNSILFVREWVVYVMHPAYVWLPNVTHLGFPVVQTLQLHNQLRACLWQYSPYFAVLTFICIGPVSFSVHFMYLAPFPTLTLHPLWPVSFNSLAKCNWNM